jgi:radical SAM superfamily enzyme YgiQ (UPF0313 family)
MTKTALVINPWVTDFKLYDEWMHPLGLYFLISLLKHNNYDVHFFNCLARPEDSPQKRHSTGSFEQQEYPKPEVYRSLKRRYKLYGRPRALLEDFLAHAPKPDIICLGSAMTYWLPGLVETAACVKDYFPDVPIVIGGISAQLIPDALLQRLPYIYLYTKSLFDQQALIQSGIPGIRDLSITGWNQSLIPGFAAQSYMHHGPLLGSLGCPMACSYCASKALQPTFCSRSIGTIIDEMRFCKDTFGIQDFALYDDAFLYQPQKHCIPLLKALIQSNLDCTLHVPNGLHAKWLSSEILEYMVQAGFKTLRLGYESGNARYSADTSAKASQQELAEAVKRIQAAGFSKNDTGVYVLAGLDEQTPQDVLSDIDFVGSLSIQVKPVFLSPVPRTALFEKYSETHKRSMDDPLYHNDSFFITQLPGWNAEWVQHCIDAAKRVNSADAAYSVVP